MITSSDLVTKGMIPARDEKRRVQRERPFSGVWVIHPDIIFLPFLVMKGKAQLLLSKPSLLIEAPSGSHGGLWKELLITLLEMKKLPRICTGVVRLCSPC